MRRLEMKTNVRRALGLLPAFGRTTHFARVLDEIDPKLVMSAGVGIVGTHEIFAS